MGLLSKLFRGRKTFSAVISILGPSKAGKTTLVRYLETGRAITDEVPTTLGVDVRRQPIVVDNWQLKVIDVGGQRIYQQAFWELSVQQAEAIIYVVDGTVNPQNHREQFEAAREQFDYMLRITDKETPLLVLINKQDLEQLNPLSTAEATRHYGLDTIRDRSIILLPTSAKYGQGVDTAMLWLLETLELTKEAK